MFSSWRKPVKELSSEVSINIPSKKEVKWTKWFALGLGGLLGLSHLSMILMLANRESKYPEINLPTTDYSSYEVMANEDGYSIRYKANDPKIMRVERDVKRKGGFLGFSNNTTSITEEYSHGGSTHHGGPVSNHKTWIDPSALGGTGEKKLSAKTVKCIEAAGGGKNTGRIVGGSLAATTTPALSGIPIIGWVLSGAATMIGMNEGAKIGGDLAEQFAGCNDLE